MTSEERRQNRYQRRVILRQEKKNNTFINQLEYDKVFTFTNLYKSYKACKKGVIWKSSTQQYKSNALLNVFRLYKILKQRNFKSQGFHEFEINERGKKRRIRSVHISERIVQKTLCDYSISSLYSHSFIYDNGASLKNKGVDFSIKRVEKHLQQHYSKYGNVGYVLVFDFSKFFDNINHKIMLNQINNQIIDQDLKTMNIAFIKNFGEIGLGMGSQVSQICSLLYPDQLDHYIKEHLNIKGYGRYMDDGYLIHHSKEYLTKCLIKIQDYCNQLKIKLNIKKTQLIKLSKGFTFLKTFFFMNDHGRIIKKINKKSITRVRKKLKKLKMKLIENKIDIKDVICSYQSWRAYAKKFNSYHTIKNTDNLFKSLFSTKEVLSCIK